MPDSSRKNLNNSTSKRLTVKRKHLGMSNNQVVYRCNSFDDFCNFCEAIKQNKTFDIKTFSKNISLYIYNNTYYLIVKNINTSYEYKKTFYSVASEFLVPLTFSDNFENKLVEHGKAIIKKNAILTGIKYFISK